MGLFARLRTAGRRGAEDVKAAADQSAGATGRPIDAEVAMGQAFGQLGQRDEAMACYRRAIAIDPDHGPANYFLATVMLESGHPAEAIDGYRRALQANPRFAEAHASLGNAFQAVGQPDAAATSYREALAIEPRLAWVHVNLGNVLAELGQPDDAIATYRQALAIAPDYALGHLNLANALKRQGRMDDAVASFEEAIALEPERFDAHYNLANTLSTLGRHAEAITEFDAALQCNPDFAQAHCNLGNSLRDCGRLREAIESYRNALARAPDLVNALTNLGLLQNSIGHLEEATACLQRALDLRPELADSHSNLGTVLRNRGKFDAAIASYRRAVEIKPDAWAAHSNLLFAMSQSEPHSAPECLEAARRFGREVQAKGCAPFASWACETSPGRLRVGLVSGDLLGHPVGYFLEGLLTHIDQSRVEFVAYPTFEDPDRLTAILRRHCSEWKPLIGLADDAAAELIHADRVHVLLDLAGHTAHNRLPVFGRRPAPVQCSWLGYFATTGVAQMDYLLGDRHVTPAAEESHFTERIVRLPDSYLCFAPPDVALAVAPPPALQSGQITFGSFNSLAKMNDAVVQLWARVLGAVPGSRLLLKTLQLNDAATRGATLRRFAAAGIEAGRLILEGFAPRAELLAAYSRVDIALDPFPYPGGTTSVEGLWMGVPVIVRRGNRFLSHVGESIAHSAGMSDWIASDDDDYVRKAVRFASNIGELAELRARLRQQVMASPVFDATRFARNFEAAMWQMWQRSQHSPEGTQ